MLASWKRELSKPAFRRRLYVSIPVLVALLLLVTRFLTWVEARPGVILDDPILRMVGPIDLTWPIFVGIYAGLVLTLYWAAHYPWRWVMGIQAYALFLAMRALSMWVAPFDPPPLMIPLEDPIVSFAADGKTLTRDLFFSGHTATGTLLVLVAPKIWQRWTLAAITVFVATAVVLQHVHYTVDVIVAPFVAYCCYRAALWITPQARQSVPG
ncbi:MAG: phosphatase PAP2-related protein [Planctomycetota bacterium]|nr:phosphatase PAP2-related protein [Planctomycetota bacterium]